MGIDERMDTLRRVFWIGAQRAPGSRQRRTTWVNDTVPRSTTSIVASRSTSTAASRRSSRI